MPSTTEQHEPWIDRVRDQRLAGTAALEAEYASQRIELDEQRIDHATFTKPATPIPPPSA
jgi:hypothetical protein